MRRRPDIRNVAIIAHVDHGKTTLVDCLFRQAGTFRQGSEVAERVMDSNDLEKERGITILAKNTSVRWKDVKINIVDTPGHADFGGEVERVLNMVDAVLLVVDAVDGPMPQTRFVLRKAFDLGLKPIVVINKVDRQESRAAEVVNEVFDLCIDLDASEEQADFQVVYASARDGWATRDLKKPNADMSPLLDLILEECPAAPGESDAPLALLIAALDYDPYVGRLSIGRILRGRLAAGDVVALVRRDGRVVESKVRKLLLFDGLKRSEAPAAEAGEIVAVAGFEDALIGETIAARDAAEALPSIAVEEPTLSMHFLVNDSPFAGTEGTFVTSRHIGERLDKELRTNVALKVEPTGSADAFKVSGRGELHLGILVETMRREGYEFALSRPEVVTRSEGGRTLEPWELLFVDVEEAHMGRVIENVSKRGGVMTDLVNHGSGRVKVEFHVPTKGLIGLKSEFLTETRGTGILHTNFLDYRDAKGEAVRRSRGVMIVKEPGDTTAYSLEGLEPRGELFVPAMTRVYMGQIVGLHSRESDIVVNPCKKKHLTNMRSSTSDIAVKLTPARVLTLEQSIEFINDDELVEVTPKSLRLRKKVLDHSLRKLDEKAGREEREE